MSFILRIGESDAATRRRGDTAIGLLCVLAFAGMMPISSEQKPPDKERDLRLEKDVASTPGQPQGVRIPRSYALVVGIANYQNLAAAQQLQFPERDADAIYSILISTEGGNFRAENVHKLVGPKATLARLRYELEEWLPSVTKDDDRVLISFAGHGFVYGGKAYLAPYDIDLKNITATGYGMDGSGRDSGLKIQGKW